MLGKRSKYQTSMHILRTIKDGSTSLMEIMESTYLPKKKAKGFLGQLTSQGFLGQGYDERGKRAENYELTKKGTKTLTEFEKVEVLLKIHAPEMLIEAEL
ncbi:MAG: winged helix-turn-helix domain-containing protein [Candidatus Bathyarchaeota archaeon]|nr:winged helix-turn-helix domain-containing protein [Candidatus Bathyarchaeota archaeon]